MKEETFAGLRLAAARANQVFMFKVGLVGAEASAGPELCEVDR